MAETLALRGRGGSRKLHWAVERDPPEIGEGRG